MVSTDNTEQSCTGLQTDQNTLISLTVGRADAQNVSEFHIGKPRGKLLLRGLPVSETCNEAIIVVN